MGGVGAVLKVLSAAWRQGDLELLGPFLIGPGEPKHLVRRPLPKRCQCSLYYLPIRSAVKTSEIAAGVIIKWPAKPSVLHPHRFPSAAEGAARIFASAAVRLAAIKRDRRLR
jgi:hypothetical protein